jgi:diaminopimelate epimerase
VEGWIQTNNHCAVNTLGGTLEVTFERENETFKNIWLKGPAMFVFKGEYSN